MQPAIRLFSALSDETRLRLFFALRHGELCVCQLTALLELAPSTISKHLSLLRDAGLLASRKKGRWVYYRMIEHSGFPIIGKNAPALFQSLDNAAQIKRDDKKLKQICREDMDDLCRRLVNKK